MNTSKYAISSVAVLILLGAGWYISSQRKAPEGEAIKIGAILTLSGSAALWGEQLRNAMEMAKEDLAKEGITVVTFYEDSGGDSAKGVSAYQNLVTIHHVDVVFSALSRVAVPLIPLADQNKTPLIMTLVSATDATGKSPYAFRIYNTAAQYVEPYFATVLTREKYDSIGIVYVNDEFGVSVRDAIRKNAQTTGIPVTIEESFISNTNDFRTQLTHVKAKKPGALFYVTASPAEGTNIVRQAREIEIGADLFDGSNILSSDAVRQDLGVAANGVYVTVFPFVLGTTGEAFRQAYKERYQEEPIFAAPFGYDTVLFVAQVTEGKKMSGDDFIKNAARLTSFDSLNGKLSVSPDREVNPTLTAVQVVDGKLVPIK